VLQRPAPPAAVLRYAVRVEPGPYLASLRARDRQIREARRERAREVRERLPALVRELSEGFGVRRVVLFGSLLTGELYERSDIDLAVEGLSPDEYWRALDAACVALGVPVDLVRLEEAPTSLADRIAREGEALHA
jgi:predicted nucleotidyltransferase